MTAHCLACGHFAAIDGELSAGIYRCDECKTLMIYGQRVFAEQTDESTIVVRLQSEHCDEVVLRLHPIAAGQLAKNLLSLVLP